LVLCTVAVLSVVPAALLAADGAFAIQVIAAVLGALLVTAGATLLRAGWTRRRESELWRLLAASGWFLCCAGLIGVLAGIGLYH
jgi:uncharacterized membrane protein HdeD (DUF308 family)